MPDSSPLVAFDLEGPLSPNDNAYELMQLIPGGDHLFEVLSRYDDLLTLEGRKGYEPGGTLALIVPFLIYHGISQKDIQRLTESASLTPGAAELVARLQSEGWRIHVITTTYCPYARTLAQKLDIDPQNVHGTVLSLEYYRDTVPTQVIDVVAQVEEKIGQLQPVKDDNEIKQRLDDLFWGRGMELCWLLQETAPMGGRRKLLALRNAALSYRLTLGDVVAVGDSITDSRMLDAVNREGGLAIAFNANEYALPYATMSLASTSIFDLWPALDAWRGHGRQAAMELVKAQEGTAGSSDRGNLYWHSLGKPLPVEVHKRIRRLVRAKAAELG